MRLNKSQKEEMVYAAIKDKTGKQLEVLKNKVRTIAQRTADEFYPKEVRDWMDACPSEAAAFQRLSSIALIIKETGEAFTHPLSEARSRYRAAIHLSRSLKVLAEHAYNSDLIVTDAELIKVLA